MVCPVDRHTDVVKECTAGNHNFSVASAHSVIGDHRWFNPALGEQPGDPQTDVEHYLHVNPGVVGHSKALGMNLRHGAEGAAAWLCWAVLGAGLVFGLLLMRWVSTPAPVAAPAAATSAAFRGPRKKV